MPTDQPVLSIDLRAVQENYRTVEKMVGRSVSVSAVVKSDAYGLGSTQLSAALHEAGCTSFFVADVHEAQCVRRMLDDADIIVLSGISSGERDVYRSGKFTAVCHSLAQVAIAAAARIPFALNLDTGFGRLGLRLGEAQSLAHSAPATPVLMMSHLACADEPSNPQNVLQLNRFVTLTSILGLTAPRSLAASSGLSLEASYRFDRVRVGSALYGLHNPALGPNPFLPVVRLSARLLAVIQVPRGEGIGYMGTFRTDRRTRLGVVGIGYKHGLAWSAHNRFCAELGGYAVPLVGRISMEHCAIDLTELPASLLRAGARVDFISSTHHAEEIAHAAGTVAQEILVRAGASCRRSYIGTKGSLQ
ncbi:alanine racemase [Rhizobium sp. BG4]|uniref:alanine racemase n=1 Tax=Rhizobium sp. BG4 TaxID=2613770 RepID=UPI00193D25C3|nr:alanine racemase [Rhizobium sp. BG4]QRM47200.1 alanine racemase [Rhizobium sp. BG4]